MTLETGEQNLPPVNRIAAKALYIPFTAAAAVSFLAYWWAVGSITSHVILYRVLAILIPLIVFYIAVRVFRRTDRRMQKTTARSAGAQFLFAFALVFTAGAAARVYVIETMANEPFSDYSMYMQLGRLLSDPSRASQWTDDLRGYLALFPGTLTYPMLVLQGVFALFGDSLYAALYANLAVSMVNGLLIYRIARRFCGRFPSLAAMAAYLAWPSLILYSSLPAAEPAGTLCFLLGVWLFLPVFRLFDRNRLADAAVLIVRLALSGVLFTLSSQMIPVAAAAVPAASLTLLFYRIGSGERKRQNAPGLKLLSMAVVLLSSCAAAVAMHQAVKAKLGIEPVSGLASFGYSWMTGVNRDSAGGWNVADSDYINREFAASGDARAAHVEAARVAGERMRGDIPGTGKLFCDKFVALWRGDDFGVTMVMEGYAQNGFQLEDYAFVDLFRPVSRFLYGSLLFFVFVGAARSLRKGAHADPMQYLTVLTFSLIAACSLFLEYNERVHCLALPLLILYAAHTLETFREARVEGSPSGPVRTGMAEAVTQ